MATGNFSDIILNPALIRHSFREVSSGELQQLELVLKKIGKRAESQLTLSLGKRVSADLMLMLEEYSHKKVM